MCVNSNSIQYKKCYRAPTNPFVDAWFIYVFDKIKLFDYLIKTNVPFFEKPALNHIWFAVAYTLGFHFPWKENHLAICQIT